MEVSLVNPYVAAAISALFNNTKDSDCVIVLYKEAEGSEPSLKQRRLEDGDVEPGASNGFGDPLPGHQFVLRHASDWFEAQLERWNSSEGQVHSKDVSPAADGSKSDADSRPVLRIPLGSEEEVPSTHAAIQFAYTGRVQASTVRQMLEVRRQGAYLQVKGCADACDAKLKAAVEGSGGNGVDLNHPPAALQLYACSALWPDLTDPSFTAVMASAKPQLVSYFGDALRVLNTPSLRQQLLDLPAVAVEALLESDSFGTDSESSVLLLLAAWMKVNYDKTDKAARGRLCQRVRRLHLSKSYVYDILPALAQGYEVSPNKPAGWFQMTFTTAAFLGRLYGSTEEEHERLLEEKKERVSGFPRSKAYSAVSRRQCLPEEGLTYDWFVTQEQLEEKLGQLNPGSHENVRVTLVNGMKAVTAHGFEWQVTLSYSPGSEAAGLNLSCQIPAAYTPHKSLYVRQRIPPMPSISAMLEVDRWRNGERTEGVASSFDVEELLTVGNYWGNDDGLPLQRPPQHGAARAGGDAGGNARGGQGSTLAAAWSEYLHDGKITGRIVLLRPDTN
ncbi:hypothetical protein Agub_g11319 [Astrephomene gubernaculifera]|uniref:BACK domain-containing protein n=1 Tax=Astrephomene gubernaculifera TaxID=47775 RepID=A0AAD3HQP0_9CHLO|nr:hypothetical protein Agub_g11319 [Astrephomene gubernaculifera]